MTSSKLLQNDGWNACVDAFLCRAQDRWQDSPAFRSHAHSLRRFFSDPELAIDAVLCVANRPTVCVKDARDLTDTQIETLRHRLWNLGGTTLLLVERNNQVQLYSTVTAPEKPGNTLSAQISDQTIANLEAAELALRLRQLIRSVETGAVYRTHKTFFDVKSSVDQRLLENLKALRDLICPDRTIDALKRAHALIGRFLFSCYLLDRGIIGKGYLTKCRLGSADDMLEFLNAQGNAASSALDRLFEALQRDFNGSLFGDQQSSVLPTEIVYLRRFLSGDDLRTGQGSLFKLYDFGFVPVELISSIYQDFLGAESEVEGQKSRVKQSSSGQRSLGAYYTPPRLAELTVDIATEGWPTLLGKTYFDAACGSGIFLVILFVRMAEEWRYRNPNADTQSRYAEMMRLLEENLRGVDVNRTACLVTCFSLYLALLDQMEPKEILELREVLEQDSRKKLLPRILWFNSEDRPPQSPRLHTVREIDFFQLPASKTFDLVIGNPPWVSRKKAPAAEKWLFDDVNNPHLTGLKKNKKESLYPSNELAAAFMWKASLHAKQDGHVCQILPSRVFLSNNTDRFQSHWLKRNRLETVWLLADYRRVLFPGAICPCMIVRYHQRQENELLGNFEFITPKVELVDPREAIIPIQAEDQKTLSEEEIVAAAADSKCALAWKKQHWGTPRDLKLIERLMRLPKLSQIAKAPPRDDRPCRKFEWFKGQGFQPASESTTIPIERFWKASDLFLSADVCVNDLILLKSDCRKIGDRFRVGLHRKRSALIYKAPLLLINKACTKFIFSDFDVLFQDDFQSICATKSEEDELLFLTAMLSSPLAQYLLFHSTANIGIERDIARLEELLALPFPLPTDMRDTQGSQKIVAKCAGILRALRTELVAPQNQLRRESLVANAQKQINALVYSYFGICEWERHLIEDTVAVFRPSSTPSSLDAPKLFTVKPSSLKDRKDYAQVLLSTFKGWTRSQTKTWVTINLAPLAELAVMTFGVGGRNAGFNEVTAEARVEELLLRISQSSVRPAIGVFQRLRGFAFFEGQKVHLIKPLNRRYWTKTAALNDADEIISSMMREDGWGA